MENTLSHIAFPPHVRNRVGVATQPSIGKLLSHTISRKVPGTALMRWIEKQSQRCSRMKSIDREKDSCSPQRNRSVVLEHSQCNNQLYRTPKFMTDGSIATDANKKIDAEKVF